MIKIEGARVHNLKNVDVEIPRNSLTVITGLSGSGKSSLAFDTIFAEGQRRYIETFSAYIRNFLGGMERPDAGFTDLIRPALYDAHHRIINLCSNEAEETYDVVGPICESSDVFDKDIRLSKAHRGDLLAMLSAGAYGEIMASGYNCRPLPKGYTNEELN